MLRDKTSSPTLDLSKLWKWVQCYMNNWRLGPDWTQAVLSALAQNYWKGVISWSDFVRCQRLLVGRDLPLPPTHLRADDLALALSQIGRNVQGRYQIDDICGFVDQGIVLQAQAGKPERLLCLTTDRETTREMIKGIPQMNRLSLPYMVNVRSVIKDGPHLYLVLSGLPGQPLPAWLMTQHPLGLPASLAENILKQIYQMLLSLRDEPQILASIHPGQLFIDPDSLTLQLLPFAVPLGQALPQGARARLYQAPSILSYEDQESFLGYRLIAIAYEIFTACVPTHNHQQMREVIKNCESLGRGQKRQIESCLLRQMNKSIALSRAAMILDVAKKRPLLDATLIVLVSLFALSAITWQAMRYAPLFLTQEAVPQTIVIEQDVKDKHVNLLKAAFFTQTQQANIAGARASWQALQQLLPADDIFVVTLGPAQLAQSYVLAAEKIMRQDPEAAGVLVRAALRLAPLATLPTHVQVLAALPYQPEEIPQGAAVEPTDGLSEEIIALTTTLIEPLPPLPPQALDAGPEPMLASTDPCIDALMQQNKTMVACMDTLSDLHFGPRLRALRAHSNQTLVMTEEAISVADYNQYCVMTGHCAIQSDGSISAQTGGLDLALNDIEQTVHDYNTYCLVSGLCEPLNVPVEPIVTLAPAQIAAYTAWLSEKTGFVYRLPTMQEWQQMRLLSGEEVAEAAQWLLDPSGRWITSTQLENKKTQSHPTTVAFYLVRETHQQI